MPIPQVRSEPDRKVIHDGSTYRFPWQPDFNPDWLHAQPLLFHVDAHTANAEALLRTLRSGG